jgi:cytochrome c oxidase assembly protein subunit 11
MSLPPRQSPPDRDRRNLRVALACTGFAGLMLGAAFAAVPLYDLFCRMTGFDGTPVVRSVGAGQVSERSIRVSFDANVAPGLSWSFAPEERSVEVRLGETRTVLYRVTNTGPGPATGIASFNVQPALTGAYFVKMQCFCFTEQTLRPGETLESAVVFYVDPALAEDANTSGVSQITLSYTYFPAKGREPVASAAAAADRN